jgi:hypothetical protein
MPKSPWNATEIARTIKALKYEEEHGTSQLRVPVEVIGAGQFRGRVGALRGGNTVVILEFRGRPACFAVPHPVEVWEDSSTFLSRVIARRNQFLQPPFCEPAHPWADQTPRVEVGSMDKFRRETAWVFANVLRNTVFLATYYQQYEVMSLIPVPPDMPMPLVQLLARFGNRFIRLPKATLLATLDDTDLRAPLEFVSPEALANHND